MKLESSKKVPTSQAGEKGTKLSNILSAASLGEIGLESLAVRNLLSLLRTFAAASSGRGWFGSFGDIFLRSVTSACRDLSRHFDRTESFRAAGTPLAFQTGTGERFGCALEGPGLRRGEVWISSRREDKLIHQALLPFCSLDPLRARHLLSLSQESG